MKRIKVGLIGYGRMGGKFRQALQQSDKWELAYICDISPIGREAAMADVPSARVVSDEDEIFQDESVQAVILSALADSRLGQIRKAVATGKHVIAEKPIAADLVEEEEVVTLTEGSGLFCTVDLYLRCAWYTRAIMDAIQSGEIGELAIIRICHLTPGLSPGEGHDSEGPSFHDCGMHYMDIARWFAGSEYKTGHAQAVRMWAWKDPWWLQCHGTFESGVVYDITQGFVYGQLSKDQTHNSYMDIIGTKGVVRMTHDFKTATVELYGVTRTEKVTKPYGGKNLDVLLDRFAGALSTGNWDGRLPTMRDAWLASKLSWDMLDDARRNDLPSIGDSATLEAIHERRSKMTSGYGLIPKR